jgi:hypothetical protein
MPTGALTRVSVRPRLSAVSVTAERLFAARRSHKWPPTVVAYEQWDTIYAEAADGSR